LGKGKGMNWGQILTTALTSSIFTAILAFLGKSIIEQWLKRNLEKFKIDLGLAAFEHQTRFTKLYEKQAEVIAELYKQLVRTQSNLRSLAYVIDSDAPHKTKREKDEAALNSVTALWDHFEECRIYLPESLGKKIEEFHKQSMLALVQLFSADISKELAVDDAALYGKYTEELAEASRILADEISSVRSDIEEAFRGLVGN
jgi:hypothetical protein